MNEFKVCFVGIGSIAKRHIRNLQTICDEKKINLIVDAYRRFPDHVDSVNTVYCSIEEVPDDYDAIFITNPTELHLTSLKMFHEKGKHFFIEKPVVSFEQIEKAKLLETRNSSIYYVACPLRYNAILQYIKNNINLEEVISVRSISSSYLPDWRPGQDYRKTYSAHKNMGGGVSVDLIHEWDYISYLFGQPQKIKCMIGKKSRLEIDSDDYAIYIAEYTNKIVELHLDYFGRKTIREIQLFCEGNTIIGDMVNNRVTYLDTGKVIDFNENRDDFQKRELKHFINMIEGTDEIENGFYHGLQILNLTQGKLK